MKNGIVGENGGLRYVGEIIVGEGKVNDGFYESASGTGRCTGYGAGMAGDKNGNGLNDGRGWGWGTICGMGDWNGAGFGSGRLGEEYDRRTF